VSRFIQAACACDESEIVEQLGGTAGVGRLTEICNWPHGFATFENRHQLSFQRMIVPLMRLVTSDNVRLSTCERVCVCVCVCMCSAEHL
jgi:hypothetical protein